MSPFFKAAITTIAFGILMLVFVLIMTSVTIEEQEAFNPCHPGQKVYVNKKYVGCTNDPQSPANTWIPD